jgi:hypothetical protein
MLPAIVRVADFFAEISHICQRLMPAKDRPLATTISDRLTRKFNIDHPDGRRGMASCRQGERDTELAADLHGFSIGSPLFRLVSIDHNGRQGPGKDSGGIDA